MASHRLIQHLGKTYGLAVSEAIYDLLNVYYFVDGHSLNDLPRLAHVVAEKLKTLLEKSDVHAHSEDELLQFLNGNEGRVEIEQAVSRLNELGVHGIPFFIIEGHAAFNGAAHSDAFINVFRDIEERGFIRSGPLFGEILGISPEVIEGGSHSRPCEEAA